MNEDYEPEEFDPDEFGEYEELADINEVIDALLDSESTLPPRYLYRLSGLEGLELEQFIETWLDMDATRRERLPGRRAPRSPPRARRRRRS